MESNNEYCTIAEVYHVVQQLQECMPKRVRGETVAGVIADILIKSWSEKLYWKVERIILRKAIAEGYFSQDQLPLVKIFDDEPIEKEEEEEDNDENTMAIHLVWDIFNMKKHFEMVNSHRQWIRRSYERLRQFLTPELDYEIIDRHDLSKFAFSQAIGYTLRWVWGMTDHPLWQAAKKLHIFHEPHHPQMWSNAVPPKGKVARMTTWLRRPVDDSFFSSTKLPVPFLHESLIDMVACEWERKKGGKLSLHTKDLVKLEGNFLGRYNDEQSNHVAKIIEKISE